MNAGTEPAANTTMNTDKKKNKNFSDYLPPALVKDWRQCFRSRSSIGLFILLELAGWLLLFAAASKADGTPSAYMHALNELGDELCMLGGLALCVVIPFRAGSTVAADTRARGSNFLMLTPLSARSIVWGTWSSGALMVLLAALPALPLLVVRQALIAGYPYANRVDLEAINGLALLRDVLVLSWFVLGGWVMTGFYMFSAGLPRFLRVVLLATCIICGIALLLESSDLARFFGFRLYGSTEAVVMPDLNLLLLQAVDAVLLLVLFLELARRHYAAPAENCSRSVRLLALLPLLIYGALVLWGIRTGTSELSEKWRPNDEVVIGQAVFGLIFLYTAVLSDTLLPIYAMPAHAYRLWPVLPKWVQKPGLVPATLCCAVSVLFCSLPFVVAELTGDTPPELESLLVSVCATMNIGFTCMLCLIITDCFCLRSAGKRPVVFAVVVLAVFFASSCFSVGLADVCVAKALLPMVGLGAYWNASLGEVIIAGALNALAFLVSLLLMIFWRGRVNKA